VDEDPQIEGESVVDHLVGYHPQRHFSDAWTWQQQQQQDLLDE
jgi:hypothetical protein